MNDAKPRPTAPTKTTIPSDEGDPRGTFTPGDAAMLERLAPTLEKLPPSEREVVLEVFEASVSHSGPFPPPSFMAAYADLYPQAPAKFFEYADRQVTSFERRVAADIEGEADQRTKNQTYRIIGLLMGGAVSLGLIAAGAVVAVSANAPITGGFVSIVGVAAGLAGVFVQGRPLMDRSDAEQREEPTTAPRRARPAQTQSQSKRKSQRQRRG